MPRSTTFKIPIGNPAVRLQVKETARNLVRRLLLHILPLVLMILIAGWITIKADGLIQRSKQPPATEIGQSAR